MKAYRTFQVHRVVIIMLFYSISSGVPAKKKKYWRGQVGVMREGLKGKTCE